VKNYKYAFKLLKNVNYQQLKTQIEKKLPLSKHLHKGKTVTKEEIDDTIGTQQQRSENSSLKPKLTR